MQVLVAINPHSSRAEASQDELRSWFDQRARSKFVASGELEDLKQALIRHGPGVERIVIGAGDGTISALLPELLALKKPVAVLPLGTANDFARTIGVPDDASAAAAVALDGREHPVDIACVNGRPFLNVVSVGLAAKALQSQSKALKQRFRVLSYPLALLRAARETQPFMVELDVDGAHCWSGYVYQASVGNGRFHGGGLAVAPDAAIDDGKFDVYLVHPGKVWQLAASITHLKFGLAKPEALTQRTARHVVLRTRKPRPLNVDGDLHGETPAEFDLMPAALRVMVPRDLDPANRGLVGLSAEREPAA